MAMVVVDDSCLQADSQPESGGLVWGLTAACVLRCIHQMNRVNSRNDLWWSWWQHYKYRPWIIIIIIIIDPVVAGTDKFSEAAAMRREKVGAEVTLDGSAFHARAPATGNARPPTEDRRVANVWQEPRRR